MSASLPCRQIGNITHNNYVGEGGDGGERCLEDRGVAYEMVMGSSSENSWSPSWAVNSPLQASEQATASIIVPNFTTKVFLPIFTHERIWMGWYVC